MEPRTVEGNYKTVKEHGGDCYYKGMKGKCGRKRAIMMGQLQEVEERLQSGELIDGGDVRRVMFEDVPARTVHRSVLLIHSDLFLPLGSSLSCLL
jgi:hypothetical protein